MVCKLILFIFLQGMVTVGILPVSQKPTDQGAADKATVIYIVIPKAEKSGHDITYYITWILSTLTAGIGLRITYDKIKKRNESNTGFNQGHRYQKNINT